MVRTFKYDVVVVGGGTAGVAAAVGSSKAGAKVLLIERNPYLGGEATHSGVNAFCGFFSCGENPVKVVEGVGNQVLEEMEKLGPTTIEYIISAAGNKNINFQTEYLKCAMDNLLEKENVNYLLHARVISSEIESNKIRSIQCVDDEGFFKVEANVFVDASGDANLAFLSGAETMWGDSKNQVQAATLPFRLSGVDISKDMSPTAVENAIRKAKKDGITYLTKEKGFIIKMTGSDSVTVLLPSAMISSISSENLTEAEKDTRRQVLSYVEAFKRYMPGMEKCQLIMIGPSIGFRETRRLHGKEIIQIEDVLERRKRADGIARGGWKPEIHKSLNEMGTYLEVENGSYFDIPLGALQSINIENLYGAGRIISSDEVAFAAVRVMGTCFATGHAAGVAAAYQALNGNVNIEKIRKELENQKALI
ncbi:FAD-dependent oxidoreductase [Fusobacterium simiae]|uniref:FAD-dependent oxidoreductase n=1 Tax=Fusobacterium simiae TaxID=855 RepID=A0ABT4DL80_FUSSI|nr:FAD-dependent oxidoreductase [Fusobacterium simiae]MCY7009209.1 FAD-dependent oxidoreductase [Fusobacterium simiae]